MVLRYIKKEHIRWYKDVSRLPLIRHRYRFIRTDRQLVVIRPDNKRHTSSVEVCICSASYIYVKLAHSLVLSMAFMRDSVLLFVQCFASSQLHNIDTLLKPFVF